MDFLSFLTKEQLELIELLKEQLAPHTKKAYIVGGALRDAYLGIKAKDLDIEIYGLNPNEFEIFASSIGAKGVGKSFFVYKWQGIDLSLPRTENKINQTHQGFEVSYCDDEKKASSRRDFTMNALMFNIFTGEILDFWGGVEDIKSKTIRFIDEQKFTEDSLRVLRGVRFSSCFDFSIDEKTLQVMKQMDLSYISKERIFWELEKIFLSSHPDIGLTNLHKIGFFFKYFGVDVSEEKLKYILLKLNSFFTCKNSHIRKYIFLHVVLNELNLPLKQTLKNLHVSSDYLKYILKSPYKTLPISDYELALISLDMPLKDWLGITQKGLTQRAKTLGFYEKKFDFIKVQDVIKDGFEGGEISKELRKRQLSYINKHYKTDSKAKSL